MRFTWDEKKNQANSSKHGVDFDLAASVFADQNRIEGFSRHKDGEDRYYAIGQAADGLLLFVVFTWRLYENENEKLCRIISARAASREERRRYPALP